MLVVALYRRVEPGSGLGARSQAELGGRPRGVLGAAVVRSVAVTVPARRLRAAPRRGEETTTMMMMIRMMLMMMMMVMITSIIKSNL